MQLDVTFKNLKARDEIRNRAVALHAKLERFLDPASEAHLVVNFEHGKAIFELTMTLAGETHVVQEEDDDLRTALDRAFHTMEVRLRRSKERRQDRSRDRGAEPEDGFVPGDH